ncbi:hypothetical protein [Hymenobacter sp. YC55]|uniref:hypothetical protein n=1 Tax=Hymenobacter sp. YC55 TaxID=3034019 RepID=UPI0023F7C3E8|nr:hypothetical protein [Hymenobacter sp. YC55]MDF7810711.1 hypothetical protein [Hymenobacter sp. YC55]
MAITDNTFTPEELDTTLAANPALKDHLVDAVKKLGYVARTTDEENTFIGSKTKEIYDGLDKDIFDTSGIAKNPTEKTYEFAKRVIGGLKTSVTEATTPLQTKIAELEKTIADGNGDATLRAQLEVLQKKEETYQNDIKDRDTKLFQKDVMLDMRDGLRSIKFDPSVKESVVKILVKNAQDDILRMAAAQKNADGTETVVYIRDGKTVLDDKNQPADAAYILQDMLKDIVEAGQQGAGGGAGGNGSGGNGGNGSGGRKALPAALPATVKNQGQLMDFLKEFGLAADSKEYDEAFDKFSAGLPLR